MTARCIQDEIRFWESKQKGSNFKQNIISVPRNIHPGYHCGYCQSPQSNVFELKYSNKAIDGPPFLPIYFWDNEIFTRLMACGVTPTSVKLTYTPHLYKNDSFALYHYLIEAQADACLPINIKSDDYQRIAPELKASDFIQFNLSH